MRVIRCDRCGRETGEQLAHVTINAGSTERHLCTICWALVEPVMFNSDLDPGPTFAVLIRAIDNPDDPEAVETAEKAITTTLPILWVAGRKVKRGRRG